MTPTVCSVVVTHDRRDLLAEALGALAAQTRPLDAVLVVDNASADGTAAMVRERHPGVELLELAVNAGGAGGFHAGMRAAHARGFDWLWLMDDDTIAEPDALEQLLAGADRAPAPPALLASRALWTDGRLHPMNEPGFARSGAEPLLDGAARGLIPLRTATFVSLLVARATIDRHGLPLAGFFLWSDDIEYTARVLRREPGYLVCDSVAVHKTAVAHTAVSTAGGRFYYHVRNTLYMLRGPAWAAWEKPALALSLGISIVAHLRHHGFARAAMATVLRGLGDGLRRRIPRPAR